MLEHFGQEEVEPESPEESTKGDEKEAGDRAGGEGEHSRIPTQGPSQGLGLGVKSHPVSEKLADRMARRKSSKKP